MNASSSRLETRCSPVQFLKTVLLTSSLLIAASACATKPGTPPAFAPWYPSNNQVGDPIFGVFEGRVPCGDCEVIKLGLALYWNPDAQSPTTYQMSRVHVGKGNDRTVNEGSWVITSGTSLDPQAVVYQLDSLSPPEFRSFLAIGDHILLVLDDAMNPRVGNAAWSYALSRTN